MLIIIELKSWLISPIIHYVSNIYIFFFSRVFFFRLTVNKDGPNKGRQFYGCPKGMNSTCKFFKWADDDDVDHENMDWNTSTVRGRGRGRGNTTHNRHNAPKRPRPTGGKRKCGNCGMEGNVKKNLYCVLSLYLSY
jgi:hypothetical protein